MVVVYRVIHAGYPDHCTSDVRSPESLTSSHPNQSTSYILVEWEQWVTPTIIQVPVSYMVPINLGVFIFASVYEFILALDAIHNKNNVLLFSICVCDACSFAYSIMQ